MFVKASDRAMRDLIVKINGGLVANNSQTNDVDGDDDDDVGGGRGEVGGGAGASWTSSSSWPDFEVLDPEHAILQRFQADLSKILQVENENLSLKIAELVS